MTKWATNITVHEVKLVEDDKKENVTPTKSIETPPIKDKEVNNNQEEDSLPF